MSIKLLPTRAHHGLRVLGASLRRRVTLGALALGALLAVPTVALGTALPQWFQLWTGGAPLMLSGEGIGSLPAYLTPDSFAPVPGATQEQLALQSLPSVEFNVPYTATFDVVTSAQGDGYVLIGPGENMNDASLRLFGDLAISVDPTHLEGRQKTMSWSVGPDFDGATLYYVIGGASTMGTMTAVTGSIVLPVDSAAWQTAFDQGAIILALVRQDGAVATLHLDATDDGSIVAFQNLP